MTVNEFVTRVHQVTKIENIRWKYIGNMVRSDDGKFLCPINTLASKLGKAHPVNNGQWVESAEAIGLDFEDGLHVVCAADGGEEYVEDDDMKGLRKNLVKACGLPVRPELSPDEHHDEWREHRRLHFADDET